MNKTTIMNDQGYLELIMGCMFSGKTTKLLEIYNMYKVCDVDCCVINYSKDTRYSETHLMSHDKKGIPCIFTDTLNEFCNKKETLDKYNIFLINEGQFFPDLLDTTYRLLEANKKIYIAGLDGDFKQQKFGSMIELIPMADKYIKLYAICKKCKDGTKAVFSKRITNDTCQTVIGSTNYIPVCRKCYSSE